VKLIDRFTRDEVSAKVWWPLALLGIIALVVTFPAANRAADDVRAEAAGRAATLSRTVIEPEMQESPSPSVVTGSLSRFVADDPVWSAARVWSPQFTLWASSVRSDPLGSGEWINDDQLKAAMKNGSYAFVTDRLPTNDAGPTTFHAYTAIDGSTGQFVTELEARDSVLLADVHRDWLGYRIVAGLATLLLLGLAILSMREPFARIGTNVPFYPESVPADRAVVELDRAVELDQADDRVQDRIAGLQERLDESERSRLKTEAQLQQALTALGSGGRSISVPRPGGAAPQPEPATREPRKSAPEAPPQPPPAGVFEPAPRPSAEPKPVVQPTPASKPAAPARQQPTPRREAPAPQPADRKKKPAQPPVQPAAATLAQTPKAPPPPVTAPAPAAKAPPAQPRREGKHAASDEPVTVSSDEVAVTAASGEQPTDGARWPDVVVLPEPEKARVGAQAHGPDSDEAVLDVLHRLVPSPEEPRTADEPGDLRARLARTAALKKPGSRERQEQRDNAHEGPSQQ
jgi:hypothetical protein